jgi:hypothetical protein
MKPIAINDAKSSIAVFPILATLATLAATAAFSGAAFAGRPLTVDDASTNDKGEGHVELWMARESGRITTFNISPAYAPFENFEIAALLTRDRTTPLTTSTLQAKWIFNSSQPNGCNVGATVAGARARGVDGTARALNGIVTCNGENVGSIHVNLGSSKAAGDASLRTWGVALEREFSGVTPSVEWYGGQGQRPTVQFSLRSEVVKNVQLDGSAGRVDGETIYSVGLKLQF